MNYHTASDLFKALSKVWTVQEPNNVDLVQVSTLDGSLRWITQFGISKDGHFIFEVSSDRPDRDVCVPEVLRCIAAQIKESIRHGDDHLSDNVFNSQVRCRDGELEFPLRKFRLDGRIVVLES